MTTTAVLLVVAAVLALADWAAVALDRRLAEYALKPAVLAVLVAVAAVAPLPPHVRPWLVAALALSLVGDVGVMLSGGDEPDGWFLGGLGAFLLGHIAYVAAFLEAGIGWKYAVCGALVVLGIAGLTLPAVVRGAVRVGGRELAVVLSVYSLLLGAMTVTAVGTGLLRCAIGGALFLVSDSLLARERFVGPLARRPVGELAVIVTYHAAQGLILLGLITHL